MDNNEFENYMINTVNANANAASDERAARFQEDLREWIERRKAKKFRAIVEIVCWVLSFATLVFAIGALNWLGEIPNVLAILIPSVVGLVAGIRIRGLFNIICQ